ncbi:MAG: T9SS type A sorting domain-containing protein [Flavobacteriales bacterium]|nr:T9SS type A sorting domain-containing protein [Flavobacteriales bacterium]
MRFRKQILLTVFSATTLMIVTGVGIRKSAGGPPYNTGAPDEKTCSGGESGNACHGGVGVVDNPGDGVPAILFNGGNNYYVSGQTYTIKPSIYHAGVDRFGFQIVALKNVDNSNAGRFVLADTSKVRMQRPTWGCCQDRWYVMHQYYGTFPASANLGEWSFQWTAPPANEGAITFYAAFLAANNNGVNDSLDETYTTTLTIYPYTGINGGDPFGQSIRVFPIPAKNRVNISYELGNTTPVSIALLDMQGRIWATRLIESDTPGEHTLSVDIPDDLPKAVYLLRLVSEEGEVLKRIVVQ